MSEHEEVRQTTNEVFMDDHAENVNSSSENSAPKARRGRPPGQPTDNQEKKQKPKKPQKGEVYDDIAQLYKRSQRGIAMHINGPRLPWPPSSGKLRIWQDGRGHCGLYREESANEFKPWSNEQLALEIVRYVSDRVSHISDYAFTMAESRACADKVMALMPHLDERPKWTLFKSNEGMCLNRLDFDPAEGLCPDWEEFLSRVSNPEAFMAFVWSIFVPEADRSQMLWLWGPSAGAGKTTVMKILATMLGDSALCQTSVPWDHFSRFWAMPYEHARLVVYTDYTSNIDVGNSIFKAITGGELIEIEPKGKASYSAEMFCKLSGTSNEPINMAPNSANMRRIIQCEVKGRKGNNQGIHWKNKLMDQLQAFLHRCKAKFHELCPDPTMPIPIEFDQDAVSMLGIDDALFEAWFERSLIVDATARVKATDVTLSARGFLGDRLVTPALRWLHSKDGGKFRRKSVRFGGKTADGYMGLKCREIYPD